SQSRWKEAFARFEQELETSRTISDRHEKGRRLRESQSRWKEAFARFEQELETSRTNGDHPEEGQVQ
ncbi:MAG: hypothetical protein ACRDJK_00880, partial [Actinomycetota bacterium]